MTFVTSPECEQIFAAGGHVLVTGGPGCGKTTVALRKAMLRISRGLKNGQRILFLSFSRAAVARIAQSARRELPKATRQSLEIQTFHSFCWQIVRGHGYAFKHKADCAKAHRLYGWDMTLLKRFKLVRDPLTRIWKANMEIISLMRGLYPRASWSIDDRRQIWSSYWSETGPITVEIPVVRNDAYQRESFSSGEIWEYLIEGRLQLIDKVD